MPGPCRHAAILALLLVGCARPSAPAPDPGREAQRVSMALRGLPATAEERARVRADPGALDALVDEWLADPAFAETMADWHAELLQLRDDTQRPLPSTGPLEGVDRGLVRQSVSEAPLRRLVWLVEQGRPYTDWFTGRAVATDAVGAAIWGLPFDAEVGGWQQVEWPDDRPAAGILVDSNLWSRHVSSDTNLHRARANLVHRAWLCEDLSARVLDIGEVDLADPASVGDAVRDDPACAGCHDTLDPLAASFAGWRRYIYWIEVVDAYAAGCPDPDFCYPLRLYAPDVVPDAAGLGLPAPALAGRPLSDLADLAAALVEDPRFAPCVARQMAAWMGQEDLDRVPTEEVDRLAEVFVDSGHDLAALARAVVRSDRFAAQGGEVGPLVARPEQVARSMEALTGLRWMGDPDGGSCTGTDCWGPVDLGRNARWGYREVAGGIDGYDSLRPVHAFQPLRHLAVGRMAEELAAHLVALEAERPPAERRLFTAVDDLDRAGSAAVGAQLLALHERVLGERPDPAAVQTDRALWEAIRAGTGSARRAWAGTLAAMLQSPDRVLY